MTYGKFRSPPKADMRANYPFGLVAGNMQEDGVRIHSSSGTTGNAYRHCTFTARSGLVGQGAELGTASLGFNLSNT